MGSIFIYQLSEMYCFDMLMSAATRLPFRGRNKGSIAVYLSSKLLLLIFALLHSYVFKMSPIKYTIVIRNNTTLVISVRLKMLFGYLNTGKQFGDVPVTAAGFELYNTETLLYKTTKFSKTVCLLIIFNVFHILMMRSL